MIHDELPKLIREILYAQEHRLLEDEVGRAAMDVVHGGVADGFVRGIIRDRVRKHRIHQAFAGPFPRPNLTRGDFCQGLDVQGRPVLIPLQWLNAHSLTLAGSGSGKTNTALFHALQIGPRVRGLWLFDCRKREFSKIKRHLARVGVDLTVLPVRSMKINPLQVPIGVHPGDWIPRAADTLVLVLELPPRASKMLQSILHRLFRQYGVFDGKALFPTLFDLLAEAKRDKEANPPARQALIDSLDPLLADLGPEVLAYRRGWAIHELAGFAINFVLGGVSEVAQNLILNTLILAEFTSRIARGISNPVMDLYISVDEGQRLVSVSGAQRSALSDLWPLIRGTGIGLDISVPSSQGLMAEALSFTATKYLGRCGSAADYETIGRAIGLSREQLNWTFHHLRPGRMIAQVGEGDWRFPYVLDYPLLHLAKSDRKATNDTSKLTTLTTIPAKVGSFGENQQ